MGRVRKLKEKWQLGSKIRQAIPKVNVSSNTAKIMMSVLVSVCCVGVASGETHAANAPGTLGVCNIRNPRYSSSGSTYDYVYFGNIPASGKELANEFDSSIQGKPMLWRVLNTTANGYDKDTGETAALFMLTEYALPTQRAWDGETSAYGQIWDDYYTTGEYKVSDTYEKKVSSTVRGFLQGIESGGLNTWANGKGMYQKCFGTAEQAAIMTTVKKSETMETYNDGRYATSLRNPSNSTKIKWHNNPYYAYGCPLRGDTIFLLSAEEAVNTNYGFSDATQTSGYVYAADTNRKCKQNAASGSAIWWWLRSGYSSINYHVAAVGSDGVGSRNGSNYGSGSLRTALNLHLASVIYTSPASGATATASPSGFKLVSSTAPSAVAMSGKSTAPTEAEEIAAASKLTIIDPTRNFSISSASVSGNTITINYEGSKTGTGEHILAVLRNNNASGTHYQGSFVTNVSNSSGTVNMTLPSGIANGTYRLIVYNEKDNGTQQTNYAGWDAKLLTVGSTNTLTDIDLTGPVASGWYTGTKINVTAQDTASGLWKITSDAAGTDVIYTYTDAPKTEKTIEAESALSTVYVFDKEGNKTKVELEKPTNAIGTLGVCNIGNPTYNSSGSTYNYVYFGNVPSGTTFANEFDSSIQGKPMLWRVLNTTANDDDKTPALFMLTEYALPKARAWDENNNGDADSYRTCGQIWDDYYATGTSYGVDRASTVRGFLQGITSGKKDGASYAKKDYNGNGMYQNCFSSKEQAAIMTTVKTSETMEVKTDTSNPTSIDDTRIAEAGTSTKRKWNSYDAYGCPLRGDTIFLLSVDEAANSNYGFQQPANTTTKPSADTNRICKQSTASGSAMWWWLRSGYSSYYYSVATVAQGGGGTDGARSDLSAGLMRAALNLHLSSVIYTSEASGATSPASPYVFNSVSSTAPSAVAMSGKSTAPTEADEIAAASKLTIVDPTRNFSISSASVSGNRITINYEGSETGTGEHILAVLRNNNASGIHYQGRFVTDVSNSSGTVNMTLPSGIANGTYRLIVYNEKDNGTQQTNYAGWDAKLLTVGSTNTLTDVDLKGPVASGFYTGTKIKVTAQDTGSGLWKITSDAAGTDVIYTYTDAPTTEKTIRIESALSTVYVFDKEGNKTKVSLGNDEPPVASGFYGNGNIKVTAQDGDSGLWKITATDSASASAIATFTPSTTSEETIVASSDASTVYVFDVEENSTRVNLVQDTAAPEATVVYSEGTIKINVTDTGSGIKSVAESTTGYEAYPTSAPNIAVTTGTGSVKLVDALGNTVDVPIDTAAPTYAPVTYSQGKYTINVTDDDSGLWKVADSEANALTNGDYTGTYPKSETPFTGQGPRESIKLYDAAGNNQRVDLDYTAPTVSGFYNESKVKLVALDDDSGLWKITSDSAGSSVVKPYSGERVKQTDVVSSSATSVYAFDQAGNKSAQISLVQDTAAPEATVVYSEGTIKINVTDAGSGIAQIGTDTASYTTYPTSASNVVVNTGTASVQLVDALGNSDSVPIDTAAPTYEPVTYNEGKYTITATDDDSGLWKITNASGVVLNDTNNDSGQYESPYPKAATSFTGQGPIASIKLYDAAGNNRSVDLDYAAPEASGFYNGRKIKVTAIDTGSGLWKITETDDITAEDIEGAGHSFEKNTSSQTRVIESALTKVYVFDHAGNCALVNLDEDIEAPEAVKTYSQGNITIAVTDAAGIKSVAESTEGYEAYPTSAPNISVTTGTESVPLVDALDNSGSVEIDHVAPTYAPITYSQGTYTINVTDDDSGLWKVADSEGNALDGGDYTETYPKSETPFTGQGPRESIKLYDAAGNNQIVDLDYTAPTASGFYNGTKIKVTAKDTGSGLWKVTATNSKSADALTDGTFTQNNDEQTKVITSTLNTVYVFDHAGNASDAIALVHDTAAPTIATSYSNGKITLTVSDPAGVAKIDETSYSDYPTSKAIVISADKNQVYVEDALGNHATLTIDTTAPAITKAFKRGTTAIIDATAQGIDLCKVSESNDFSNTDTDTPFTNTEGQILTVTLSDANVGTLYVYDTVGHKAEVTLIEDTKAPTATPTYSQGRITINVGDTADGTAQGVGIKSVGGATEGYTNYPISATAVPVDTGTGSVALVDALDNEGSVDIDNTAPTGLAGYYKGTTGVLTVSDEEGGSGLWKIAKQDGASLLDVTEADRRTFNIDEGNNKVYVYDQAGNTQTEGIQLIEDTQGPTVRVVYEGGVAKITASDDAGIWRITDQEGTVLEDYAEAGRVIPQA